MNLNRLSDDILLLKIAQGQESAFEVLFNRYKNKFYSAAFKLVRSREVAEEIVQNAFVNLWLHRNSLAKVEDPKSYLFSIVYNLIKHHFKIIAKEKELKSVMKDRMVANENNAEQMMLEKEYSQLLHQFLQKLPSRQRIIYRMSKQEGYSRKEIADKLQVSPHTVKNHLLKAMKFLRAEWNRSY